MCTRIFKPGAPPGMLGETLCFLINPQCTAIFGRVLQSKVPSEKGNMQISHALLSLDFVCLLEVTRRQRQYRLPQGKMELLMSGSKPTS